MPRKSALAGMRQDCRVRIGMLGPFEVRTGDGTAVEVPGVRLRALLAALALEPGRIVTREKLVDWIWGQQPPADEVNALQALVSRLRKMLPGGVIEADSGGYRLAVPPDAVDVSRFERLVGQARAAEPAARADLLRSALELWHGTALEGVALRGSEAFDAAVARLDELYLTALGDRVDADIRLGRGGEMVSELTELVATHPLREGFVAALMRALVEAGRSAEALTVYQRTRERLAEELGVDPSAELSALHSHLDGAGWFRQDEDGHGDRAVDPRRAAGWSVVGGVGPGAGGRRAGAGRPRRDRLA